MSNSFKIYTVLLIAIFFSSRGFASIVIDGTRFIYPGGQREVSVHLSNKGELPALIQSWIDAGDTLSTPENSTAPFIVSPPVSRIEPQTGQTLRVSLTTTVLPQDRESLFWLNVVEIPPQPVSASGSPENFLQLALRSRIKLLYRPAGLTGNANTAPEKLQWRYGAAGISVKNPTPYYISFTGINAVIDQRHVPLVLQGDMLAPGEEKTLALSGDSSRITDIVFTTINDFGGSVSRSHKSK